MAAKKKKSKKIVEQAEDHYLKPKHEKLSEKEKQECLQRYNLGVNQLPGIFITDPAIANLDAKIGDIIMVTRENPFGGKSIFYREVIHESAVDFE
ncbi:MAG: DNA-directed RNA polymerase subunit RpoH/Rpb5 C-terminal domain-containing protein [Candidatus Woesearchaeota archaeon]